MSTPPMPSQTREWLEGQIISLKRWMDELRAMEAERHHSQIAEVSEHLKWLETQLAQLKN